MINWQECVEKIEAAKRHEKAFRECAKEAIEAFEGPEHISGTKFNILWANTETLKPLMYSRTPIPDVRPRNGFVQPEKNLLAGGISAVLERALSFSLDSQEYPFDDAALSAVLDFLVPGRGIARVHYESDEDEDGNQVNAKVWCEHVSWDEFTHQPAKRWDRVKWVAFDHYYTRDELVDQFGDIGNRVTLQFDSFDPKKDDAEKYGASTQDQEKKFQTALVHEFWDKIERKVLWLSPGLADEFLAEDEDPLNLELFFPTPKPLLFLKRPASLVPVPPYQLYRDQADELNLVTSRMSGIIEAMRVRGCYPANMAEIIKLVSDSGHMPDLVPVDNWSTFAEKGGLDGMISWMPIEQLAKALLQLSNRRQQLVQEIFELTGIADIIRGTTDPTETARAQTLKSQFATRRLRPMQRQVQGYIRDLLRMEAEIIAEKFSPEVLAQMTGVDEVAKLVGTMTKDELRNWMVDIETDSTVAEEELYEKQELMELLQSFGAVVQSVAPIVQTGAFPFEGLKQILLLAIRRFRPGKEMEAAIQSMQQPQPQPDPKVELAKETEKRRQQEAQGKLMIEAERLKLEQGRAEVETAVELAEALQ